MAEVTPDTSGLIVTCGSCGQRNRLSYKDLDRIPRCAKCRSPLPFASDPVDIPDGSIFDAIVMQSSIPVLVDFWADWCGPCHMVAPEIKKVAASQAGQLVVAKVDTERLPEVASRWGIQSLPTMALFVGGREAGRTLGARPASAILAFVSEHAARV